MAPLPLSVVEGGFRGAAADDEGKSASSEVALDGTALGTETEAEVWGCPKSSGRVTPFSEAHVAGSRPC